MTDRIKALRDIVEADQEDSLARFMLGKELLDHGQPFEAAAQFDMAIRLNPDHTASWRYYGQALDAAGMKEEAIRVYRLGIEVAQKTRDLQTGKEMKVFLARLEKR